MNTSLAPTLLALIHAAALILSSDPGSQRALGSDDGGSDGVARGVIFAEQQTREAALSVHQRAMKFEPLRRFEFLADRVLPGNGSERFRLPAGFSPTHPGPSGRNYAEKVTLEAASNRGESRVSIGGELISPALDLVQLADELEKLPELRSRIEAAGVQGEIQQRCQLSMLGLVDLALKDYDSALSSFDELFARVRVDSREDFPDRWPETLAVHAAVRHMQTREVAAEMLNHMSQSQVRAGVAHGPDVWDRWVIATFARAHQREPPLPGITLRNWGRGSRSNSWSRGMGMPVAAWTARRGEVHNVASHDDDYFYYRIPLTGNFEVECDVTSFGWRDSHLMIAGTYVAPVYDHVTFGVGSIRGPRPTGVIDPKLSECDPWIRYRAVVHNQQVTTYFNGRLIHTEPLRQGQEPWLAIRSPSYTDGGVRNLTIRGTPVIADRVSLSNSSSLSGWHAYHGEPVDGASAYWRRESPHLSDGAIVGQREPWLEGGDVERLLQYCRPMLEDGTIKYSFYYEQGSSSVHPSLDRQAFIIDIDGLRQHWITDGFFDRTESSPIETTELVDGPLPLRDNAWNEMRLTLEGDTIKLVLNDRLIYFGEIDAANQRAFGLFHWADQAEARAKNIVWEGDWPKKLPPIEQQELAGKGVRFLDEDLPRLTATFEHDFVKNGLSDPIIQVVGISAQATVIPGKGVGLKITSPQGYAEGWLTPRIQLHGDFDVTVRFDELSTMGPKDSATGMFLMTITGDPQLTHSGIYRGLLRRPTGNRQVSQVEFNRRRLGKRYMTYPVCIAEESTSGRLRLARRGKLIHCLLAENDSSEYRNIHTEEVASEPTIAGGLRLMNSTYTALNGKCESAVTWQHLSVHAEQITYPR